MQSKSSNIEALNSGLLFYGVKETKRDSLGRVIETTLNETGKLYYKYKTIREVDYNQYEGISKNIDIKVKTYYMGDVEKSHIVRIDTTYYDIINIDVDADYRYMYLLLAKKAGGLND